MSERIRRAAALVLIALCLVLGLTDGRMLAESAAPQIGTGNASAALLVEAASGKVLFEKNADKKLPAAGLSRLPALLVICEAFDAGEIGRDAAVSVSEAASRIGGTTAFLRPGEHIDAESLLLAAVMINAGDAIHALAQTVCGSEQAAAERINARMAELGIECGYTDICGAGATFSAAELAKLGAALIKSETYSAYGTKYYETIKHEGAGDTELANPNRLVKQYSGCIGVATGSSNEARYCGVFAARRAETTFIAVVLGAETGSQRFGTAIAMLDHGFSAYRRTSVCAEGEAFGTVQVRGSFLRELPVEAKTGLDLLLRSGESGEYSLEAELPEYAEAPVLRGDTLGRLFVVGANGELLAETELVAAEDAPRSAFNDWFRLIIAAFMHLG
ncbi:MAG: D-alanyl-D-alanine carboxypeptidase [Clostridia bacterium]|nr:D-alanyl-D-alanine carboxypeptidase [Clostridia bacterium]